MALLANCALFRFSSSSRQLLSMVSLSSSSKFSSKKREALPLRPEDAVKTAAELRVELEKKRGLIEIEGSEDVSIVSGIPEAHVKERLVRIYRPAKNAMQSGTHGIRQWRIEFDTKQRWENNLMGWASTADPLSNTLIEFKSKEEAIRFVEKNAWPYFVDEANDKVPRPKSYALNFAWNKRTRKSTK